jgi:hypothetical protein
MTHQEKMVRVWLLVGLTVFAASFAGIAVHECLVTP